MCASSGTRCAQLECISGVSQVYLECISAVSRAYLGCISGASRLRVCELRHAPARADELEHHPTDLLDVDRFANPLWYLRCLMRSAHARIDCPLSQASVA